MKVTRRCLRVSPRAPFPRAGGLPSPCTASVVRRVGRTDSWRANPTSAGSGRSSQVCRRRPVVRRAADVRRCVSQGLFYVHRAAFLEGGPDLLRLMLVAYQRNRALVPGVLKRDDEARTAVLA
jgi:hypothetical protein